jgi:hypothetical protein
VKPDRVQPRQGWIAIDNETTAQTRRDLDTYLTWWLDGTLKL